MQRRSDGDRSEGQLPMGVGLWGAEGALVKVQKFSRNAATIGRRRVSSFVSISTEARVVLNATYKCLIIQIAKFNVSRDRKAAENTFTNKVREHLD